MAPFIWLASYPKSGNTWVRILLANYLRDRAEPVDINRLDDGVIASHRAAFDEFVGVEASDLTLAEIHRFRPPIYGRFMTEAIAPTVLKVHDAYCGRDGRPRFDITPEMRVIYLIRNPLDVVVSLAHHSGATFDVTIQKMSEGFSLARSAGGLTEQIEQELLGWSDHVRGWVDAPDVRVHVVRYEDLHARTQDTARQVIHAAGLGLDEVQLERAVRFSSFEELRAQESAHGFRERPVTAPVFFREGGVGGWRQALSPEQVQRVTATHRDVMARFGYLDPHS
jgi:aryl sulfotransferase